MLLYAAGMFGARAVGSHCCPDTLLAASCLLHWLLFDAGLLLSRLLLAVAAVAVAVSHRTAVLLLLLLLLLLPAFAAAAVCRDSQCARMITTELMQDHCNVCSTCNTAIAASCWLVPSLLPMLLPLPPPP
jgi:hypothetical protein